MSSTTVREGEGWSAIAQRTLGNATLGAYLAEHNGVHSDNPPPSGGEIEIPGYPGDTDESPADDAPARSRRTNTTST